MIGVVDGPFATRNGDQHANATLVISVGKLVAFEDGFSGAPGYEIETSYFGYKKLVTSRVQVPRVL